MQGKTHLTFMRGYEEVDLVSLGVGPALNDGGPQLDVSLVHLAALAHVDLQIVADEGEQGGREVHLCLFIYFNAGSSSTCRMKISLCLVEWVSAPQKHFIRTTST